MGESPPTERATATVRTPVDGPAIVAAAVSPDHTASLATRVEGDAVVTTVERDDVGQVGSTVDDYLVNLTVATEVAQLADHDDNDTHE